MGERIWALGFVKAGVLSPARGEFSATGACFWIREIWKRAFFFWEFGILKI